LGFGFEGLNICVRGSGFGVRDTVFGVKRFGLRVGVWGSGFRGYSRLWVLDLGFAVLMVWVSGFEGFGFWVSGFGFGFTDCGPPSSCPTRWCMGRTALARGAPCTLPASCFQI
jgi:hypothetical protein